MADKVEKKIIAVVGATGAQGGGLVRAILNDKRSEFAARAITRDPSSDKAKELADAGAEVVAADVDDAKSLKKAFAGAHGAFCVTFFWAHFKPEQSSLRRAKWRRRPRMPRSITSSGRRSRTPASHPALRRPDADTDGEIQSPALRCQGRSRCDLHRARRADDVPADVVLLGQLHLLRNGSQEGSRRQAGDHAADGHQKAAEHRRRGYRKGRLCDFREGRRNDRQDRWHRRWTSQRRPDGEIADESARPGGEVQRRHACGLPRRSGFPAPTTSATCSSSTASSSRIAATRAASAKPRV